MRRAEKKTGAEKGEGFWDEGSVGVGSKGEVRTECCSEMSESAWISGAGREGLGSRVVSAVRSVMGSAVEAAGLSAASAKYADSGRDDRVVGGTREADAGRDDRFVVERERVSSSAVSAISMVSSGVSSVR